MRRSVTNHPPDQHRFSLSRSSYQSRQQRSISNRVPRHVIVTAANGRGRLETRLKIAASRRPVTAGAHSQPAAWLVTERPVFSSSRTPNPGSPVARDRPGMTVGNLSDPACPSVPCSINPVGKCADVSVLFHAVDMIHVQIRVRLIELCS